MQKFTRKYLVPPKFVKEDNSHGSPLSAYHASERFRAFGKGTVVGSFKKYKLTGKLLECFIEFNKENDNERHIGLYSVPVNKVFEALLFYFVEHSNDMQNDEQAGDGHLPVDQLDQTDLNAATMAFKTAFSSIAIYPG